VAALFIRHTQKQAPSTVISPYLYLGPKQNGCEAAAQQAQHIADSSLHFRMMSFSSRNRSSILLSYIH
jgi:hypothetical protein